MSVALLYRPSKESRNFKAFWVMAIPMMQMETHAPGTLVDVPIETDIQDQLRPVLGNSTQLMQVFTNLFRNALYAMSDQPEKQILLKARIDEGNPAYLKISFTDNGSGILEEVALAA